MRKNLLFHDLKVEPGGVKVVKLDQGLLFPAVEYLQECVLEANEAGKRKNPKDLIIALPIKELDLFAKKDNSLWDKQILFPYKILKILKWVHDVKLCTKIM